MHKTALLHLVAFYLCFLTFFRPAEAVVERGIAYVDNYDDSLAAGLKARGLKAEEYEWHKRSNGADVIKVRAEKVAVEARDQHATGEAPNDSTNDYTWGKRMKRANSQAEDHNDGTDWNKRGDILATGEEPDDSHDWLKRAPQWLNKLLKRDFERNAPEPIGPGPTKLKPRGQSHDGAPAEGEGPDDSHDWLKREEAVDKPNDSHDWLIKRSTFGPFHKSKPFPPSGLSLKVDKRGMIEEWMHPRGMAKRQVEVCKDPGWVPCPNNPGCCPTLSSCCPTICKTDPSSVCCNGYSCKAGYQCDQLCGGCVIKGGGCCPDNRNTCASGQQCCEDGCAPEGNQCCKGGGSCGKGNICVMDNPSGDIGCCTDLKCTAWVSDGVTVPLISTIDPEPQPAPETTAPPQTTQPPTNSQDVVVYYTYRFTITWWYWYYYYTYWAVQQVSTVTSSQETTITTVTVTDTATETSSLFESISSSVVEGFTTPADATTALAIPTIPTNTAQDASTDDATSQLSTITEETQPTQTDEATTTTTRSRTSTTSSPVFTGGSGSRSAGMVKVDSWFGHVMMGFAMGAGVGMVWL